MATSDRTVLLERANVQARVLRMTADREAPADVYAAELDALQDVPEVTWQELGEMSALMRESVEVIEALSRLAEADASPANGRACEGSALMREAADELNRLRTREREVFEAGFRARNVNLGWRFDGDRPYAPEAYAAYLTQAERKDGE